MPPPPPLPWPSAASVPTHAGGRGAAGGDDAGTSTPFLSALTALEVSSLRREHKLEYHKQLYGHLQARASPLRA